MMKSKAITAGAIALTLTIGGGGLWASQYANAAASDTTSVQEQSVSSAADSEQKERSGKRGGFGHGLRHIQEQLLEYLGLTESELQAKLETSTLAEAAVEQGKSREELKAKLVEWLVAQPDKAPVAVDAETDSQAEGEQKEKIKSDAASIAEQLLDSDKLGFGKHGSEDKGRGGSLEAAAALLGLSQDELRTQLQQGKTLAALAAEKGIAEQEVTDALANERNAKLSEQLAAGTITQEQYDEKLARTAEWAAQQINTSKLGGGRPEGKAPRGERTSTAEQETAAFTESEA